MRIARLLQTLNYKNMMTDKDKELIDRAYGISPMYFYMVDDLIAQADTEDAKERLRAIRSSLYHLDEYESDIL